MNQQDVIKVLQRVQNTEPLDPDQGDAERAQRYSDWYVHNLHGTKANDVIELLKIQIQSVVGSRHAYLFTGTIGSGKSTELRKLAFDLKKEKHWATVINIADYLNPQEPVGLPDLLMAISLGAWEAAAKAMGIDPEAGKRWAWWESLLTSGVELKDIELSSGFAKAKFALQANPVYRERLRKFFEGSLDDFVREANQFLVQLAEDLRRYLRLHEDAKCVLLVDSLEQFGGFAAAGQDDKVLQSLVQVFNLHSQKLKLSGWSVLYSVPPLLQKFAPSVAAVFTPSRPLTSAHVYLDRQDSEDGTTIDEKLIPLLLRRLGDNAYQIFTKEALRDLVIKSGGDLRNLMRLVVNAMVDGLANQQFPITEQALERVYDTFRLPYLPLPKDAIGRLKHVRQHKSPLLDTQADWPKVMSDLASKRILLYLNGTEWYDVHPLLRQHVDAADQAPS
jgi:hypothetical protein